MTPWKQTNKGRYRKAWVKMLSTNVGQRLEIEKSGNKANDENKVNVTLSALNRSGRNKVVVPSCACQTLGGGAADPRILQAAAT